MAKNNYTNSPLDIFGSFCCFLGLLYVIGRSSNEERGAEFFRLPKQLQKIELIKADANQDRILGPNELKGLESK
tara:strand:+ start:594 stop:815 length:222 start_codon:yes stop_codon:yes gene_type:complete